MTDGVKRRSDIEGKDNSSEDKGNYKVVCIGDMVYNSMRMWQGANGISQYDGIVSPAYTVLTAKEEIATGFFAALFKTHRLISEFRRHSQGMTSDTWNLKYPQIETIKTYIPTVGEQKKIADLLATLDRRIEKQRQLIENLKKYKRGLTRQIFESLSIETPTAELSELFSFIRNGFVGTVTPYFVQKGEGVRYLQGTNVHSGKINDDTVFYVSIEFNQKHQKNILKADDILVVQSGHVGECSVVGKKYAGSNCHALIIMSNAGNCSSKYVAQYINSDIGIQKISTITTGNTIKHILATSIAKITIPMPTFDEQIRISNTLELVDKHIEHENNILTQLNFYKQGLLQQLFI